MRERLGEGGKAGRGRDGWTRETGGARASVRVLRDSLGLAAREKTARGRGCTRERLHERQTGWASNRARRLDKRGPGSQGLDGQAYMCCHWARKEG